MTIITIPNTIGISSDCTTKIGRTATNADVIGVKPPNATPNPSQLAEW